MNQDLSPPPGGETVSVSVKVPKDLVARKMRVMYRSEKCPITRSDGSGGRYEIDGAKAIEVEPQRQGMTDIYEAKLARDGGGLCKWKLSNVTFGVHYGSPDKFGDGAQVGGGGGVIVVFDDNRPQQVSLLHRPEEAFGDLMVENKYYVWIYEQYLVREEKRVLLFDDGRLYRTYKAKNAKSVVFIPSLYSGLIYSFGRKEGKGKGSTRVIYPDGSEVFGGNTEPNINKLKEIEAMKKR
jgi:hypothetical protein